MGIFDRFFGRKDNKAAADDTSLTANPNISSPLSLQILFAKPIAFGSAEVQAALQRFHPLMSKAQCEIDPETVQKGTPLGLAGWRKQVIRLVGFNAPMPAEVVEQCVAPAHYPPELKEQARKHVAHLILYYAGYDEDPLTQYAELAAMAGALAPFGAIIACNEAAHMSFPIAALAADTGKVDRQELLRVLPLLHLYVGFVKMQAPGHSGVWMRTFGADCLGIPDFAAQADGHKDGKEYFETFETIIGYLLKSKAVLQVGETMQIEEEVYLRFRAPRSTEPFLESKGTMLVMEKIRADEINR